MYSLEGKKTWHGLIKINRVETLKFLLKKWPDVNTVDSKRNNILTIDSDENCRKILLEHIAKMEMLILPIGNNLLKTISKDKDLNNYFQKCKQELMVAKTTRIHHDYSITYSDLLLADKAKLINYGKNKFMVESFQKSDFKNVYPVYSSLMQKNLEKGNKIQELYIEAAKVLKKSLPMRNPSPLILERIIYFLEKKDLKKLCQQDTK